MTTPHEIKRYEPYVGPDDNAHMRGNNHGEYVLYADHVAILETQARLTEERKRSIADHLARIAQLEAQAQKLVANVRDVAGQQFLNWRALLGKHCDEYEKAVAQKKAGEV